MSQHTPGPWTATYYWVDGANGTRVATLSNQVAYRADSRLIAAAPEMLALIRDIVDDTENSWLTHAGRLETIRVNARALLARIDDANKRRTA